MTEAKNMSLYEIYSESLEADRINKEIEERSKK